MIDVYFIHLLILIGIYIILAVSLQLSLGYGGLLNLGHIAFFGIGAYVSAILALGGFPFLICLLMAGGVSAISGLILSFLTNKIKSDYFALVTLGFSFVIYTIFINWTDLTRGPLGLPGIPRPNILGINFSENTVFLILVFIISLISYLFIYKVCGSPFGKVLEATRDDELAAKSLGKNTMKVKMISFAISAFFAGIAGSLFASYVTFIDPSSFTFLNLIPILLIVIIGGLASLPGTILATIIITLLPELLRFINLPSSILGPTRQIIYASSLLLIIYLKPRGFFGKIDLE
jgi:branched-chain amino acid transport system permease protein